MAYEYKTRVARIAHEAYNYLKSVSPYDTGNLRYNAIKIIKHSNSKYEILIDGRIAPYAVYTNEKWISPKWNGRKNPNEKWIDMAAQFIAERIVTEQLNSEGVEYTAHTNRDEEIARWENDIYYDQVVPLRESLGIKTELGDYEYRRRTVQP
jgi:hypothetical protein